MGYLGLVPSEFAWPIVSRPAGRGPFNAVLNRYQGHPETERAFPVDLLGPTRARLGVAGGSFCQRPPALFVVVQASSWDRWLRRQCFPTQQDQSGDDHHLWVQPNRADRSGTRPVSNA